MEVGAPVFCCVEPRSFAASAKPFDTCFALSLFLEFMSLQEAMCQCGISDLKRDNHSSDPCL